MEPIGPGGERDDDGQGRDRVPGVSRENVHVPQSRTVGGGTIPPVSRPRLELELEFPATYEVEQLDRIDRSGGRLAYGFPDAVSIDPQQDVAAGPILGVTPEAGDPWVGVFYGSRYKVPPAQRATLIAWPDTRSFCVVYAGGAVVVQADDPRETYEVETFPVLGTLVVPDRRLVVFADSVSLTAYGGDGLLWRSRRLALDDLRIERIEGDALIVFGFFGSTSDRFKVDIATGQASGQPFSPE